jgi:alpha-mannosidase
MRWLWCAAFAGLTITGWAQSSSQSIHEADTTLTAQVVSRLAEFDQLPDGPWKLHNGDVAHGESITLDDANWDETGAGKAFTEDSVWLRRWIEVPPTVHGYDLTGTRIWLALQFKASTPLTEIVYFNGKRVAMGESLEEPLVLFDDAQPGGRILVAVKLMGMDGKKQFIASTEKIDFAAGRPNPEDLRQELLATSILLPTFQQDGQAMLLKAAGEVDLKALDAGSQSAFDASLRAAQTTLEPLRPVLQQATMHLTGNSHIDAAWLWPRSETIDVVRRTFSTALQLMWEYPGYTYTQSAAAYNDWMADKYPEIDSEIKSRIKEGRWEIVGGMWVEPDLNMPDGESTARSILLGKRWYQQHYGVDVRVGWNPDSFGYNWQLPQIYKKSGIDYFVTQKMSWNDTNKLPLKLFWWESPDGSKVLTYFPHGYGNRVMDPERLSTDFAAAREQAPGMEELMDLYGIGDHGGGPTRANLDEALHWMTPGKIAPKTEFGTALSYFSSIEKTIAPSSKTWDYRSIAAGYEAPASPAAGQVAIPTWKDELYLEFHRGVFTTQANHKRNMRQSSEWALDAEKYASLAWLDGDPYPGDALTEAWKKITFNQFHDLAAGSGIAVIYRDAQKDYDQVRSSTNEISAQALKTLAARVNTATAGGVPVFVFNPLAWSRTSLVPVDIQMPLAAADVSVLDAHGAVLPSKIISKDDETHTFHLLVEAKDVPSLGYTVLRAVPGHRAFASSLHVTGTTLENANLRVAVDPVTGCITSLYDKQANVETLAPDSCGNELQAFHDKPAKYDAWNIDPGTLDQPPAELTKAESVKVTETGPMRAIIRVSRSWQSSKFVQQIALSADSDEVEIINDIDWHETHVLLKSAFTLAASAPFATYEIPYGTIQRPTTRNNSWEKARFEVPALRWADLGNAQHGMSLINESKYGYDCAGNVLRLSLLRSPTAPDAEADRGHHHFRYALYPHAGGWQQAMTVRHGYEFNYPLTAMQVEAHVGSMPAEHSFVTVNSGNVVLTAMKKAEDSDALVFHMYEWAGKSGSVTMTVPPGATGAIETNLLESPEGSALAIEHDRVTLPVHPYEILAVRVEYPSHAR